MRGPLGQPAPTPAMPAKLYLRRTSSDLGGVSSTPKGGSDNKTCWVPPPRLWEKMWKWKVKDGRGPEERDAVRLEETLRSWWRSRISAHLLPSWAPLVSAACPVFICLGSAPEDLTEDATHLIQLPLKSKVLFPGGSALPGATWQSPPAALRQTVLQALMQYLIHL